ncbi:protein kinase domain-containing protein [Kitasatospora aureofaciens]|uniref:protein kinase domain-containing protein n=1 Tax=Kitasatospora aureofaciens TaxID=1894 RepID=UPI0036F4A650
MKQNDRRARHDVGPIGLMCAHSRHIVTVHEVGRVDPEGRPAAHLVLELLDGRSLDRLISDGVPDLGDVLAWAAQICDALAAAHLAGLVHRDIKPAM